MTFCDLTAKAIQNRDGNERQGDERPMKIVKVSAIPMSAPVPEEKRHRTDLGTKIKSDARLIPVATDSGLTGIGAALGTPPIVAAIIEHELAAECVDEDPLFSDRHMLPSTGSERLGLRNVTSFVAQSPTPSDHCVRFAPAVADDCATLASRRRATTLPGPVFHRLERVSFA